MSSRSHNLTNSGESIVVEAYRTSDVCPYLRADVLLTSKLLNASRAAVSMMCFFDSGELVGGNIEGTRSKNSARSDLFNGGSIVPVCLMIEAASSISSRSRPKSSTACTPWPAILAPIPECGMSHRRLVYFPGHALQALRMIVLAAAVLSKECRSAIRVLCESTVASVKRTL